MEEHSQPQPQTQPQPQPQPQSSSGGGNQDKMNAMLCHLLALLGFIGIPFGNVLGPLVMWLVKKDSSPLVDENGKESLNFQISMTIYFIISFALTFILIGIPLMILLAIADLVLVIMASVKVNNGESYQYPMTIRLIK